MEDSFVDGLLVATTPARLYEDMAVPGRAVVGQSRRDPALAFPAVPGRTEQRLAGSAACRALSKEEFRLLEAFRRAKRNQWRISLPVS